MSEQIVNGRDNPIHLDLVEDAQAADLTVVTRVLVVLRRADGTATTTVDSDTDPTAFDWTTTPGRMVLRLGTLAPQLPTGTHTADLVTIDPTNPNGISWGLFSVNVR